MLLMRPRGPAQKKPFTGGTRGSAALASGLILLRRRPKASKAIAGTTRPKGSRQTRAMALPDLMATASAADPRLKLGLAMLGEPVGFFFFFLVFWDLFGVSCPVGSVGARRLEGLRLEGCRPSGFEAPSPKPRAPSPKLQAGRAGRVGRAGAARAARRRLGHALEPLKHSITRGQRAWTGALKTLQN